MAVSTKFIFVYHPETTKKADQRRIWKSLFEENLLRKIRLRNNEYMK